MGSIGCGNSEHSAPDEVDDNPLDNPATQIDSKSYALCDGSDDVRLAIKSGGGEVEPTYYFSHPHGYQFMYVTGKCEFVASVDGDQGSLGSYTTGSFTAAQAATLSDQLGLTKLTGQLYRDVESCPDAGVTAIFTRTGYADCTCGCDDGAPSNVKGMFSALDAPFALARQVGQPVSGPVDMVVVSEPSAAATGAGDDVTWPFAFTPESVAIDQPRLFATQQSGIPFTILSGDDADLARSLRVLSLTKNQYAGQVVIASADLSYAVYLRDELPASFQQTVPVFEQAFDRSATP